MLCKFSLPGQKNLFQPLLQEFIVISKPKGGQCNHRADTKTTRLLTSKLTLCPRRGSFHTSHFRSKGPQ